MKKLGTPQSTYASAFSASSSSLPKPDFSNLKSRPNHSSPGKLSPSESKSSEDSSPTKSPSKSLDLVANLAKTYGKPSDLSVALRKMLENFCAVLNKDSAEVVTSWVSAAKREGLKSLRESQLKTLHQALKDGKINVVDFENRKISLHDDEVVRSAISQVLAIGISSEFGATPEWGGEYNSLIEALRLLIKNNKFVILRYKSAAEIYKAQNDILRQLLSSDKDVSDSESEGQFEFSSSEDSPQKRKVNSVGSEEFRKLQEENAAITKRLDHTALIFSLDVSSRSGAEVESQQRIDELQRRHQDQTLKNDQLAKLLSVKELEIAELRAASQKLSKKNKSLESKVAASKMPENYDVITKQLEDKHSTELKAQAEKFERMLAERDRAAEEREAQLRAEILHLKSKKSEAPQREDSGLQKAYDKLLKEKAQIESQNESLREELQFLGTLTDEDLKAKLIESQKEVLLVSEENDQLRGQVKALKFGGVPADYAVATRAVPRKLFADEQSYQTPETQRKPMFIESLGNTEHKRRQGNKALTPPCDDSDGSLSL